MPLPSVSGWLCQLTRVAIVSSVPASLNAAATTRVLPVTGSRRSRCMTKRSYAADGSSISLLIAGRRQSLSVFRRPLAVSWHATWVVVAVVSVAGRSACSALSIDA